MKTVFTRENIEVIEVTPNIFFRKSNIEGNNQCDGAYIVSGGTVCAVEAPSVEGMAEMAEEAQILFGKPIRYYFLTHNDWDHTDGLPALYDQPAAIFCSKNMVDMFAPKDKPCKATFIGVQGTLKLRLEGYDVELTTHYATASAVLQGTADVALGIESVARGLGLDFFPIQEERYDLVIPERFVKQERFRELLSLLRDPSFKQEVVAQGGYNVSQTGKEIDRMY